MTRVLVVEDEESFREALEFMLSKEGFEVALAATGTDALVEFERSGADLILLDLMLPGMSGTEVCRTIAGPGASHPVGHAGAGDPAITGADRAGRPAGSLGGRHVCRRHRPVHPQHCHCVPSDAPRHA